MGRKKEVERKKIVKIPFITPPPIIKADFPRFPELYLQYIENPKKVNKDGVYVPYTDQIIRNERSDKKSKHRSREKSKEKSREKSKHRDRSRREKSREKSKEKSKDRSREKSREKSKNEKYVSLNDIEKNEHLDKLLKKSKSSERRGRSEREKSKSREKKKSKDNLENYMKKDRVSIQSKSKSDRKENKKPPPINEIEANATQGKFKNLNRIAQKDMSTESLKRELLFKIEIMKKQYPKLGLPTYSMTNTVEQMRNTIDTSVKTIMLESTVTKYKRWFRIALLISEYFFTRILKMDYMSGSTQYHMKSMSEYDIMIIELGEKSYSEGSDWPVEIRLGMLALFNTALYGLSKKFDMPDLIALLSQFVKSEDASEPKRMRGPTVRLEDT